MGKYIPLADANFVLKKGVEFYSPSGRKFTVKAVIDSSSGDSYVVYENDGGSILANRHDSVLTNYFIKDRHELSKGDIFRLQGDNGVGVEFLYASDDKVFRFGRGGYGYFSRVGVLTMDQLIRETTNDWNSIVKLCNVKEYGVDLTLI